MPRLVAVFIVLLQSVVMHGQTSIRVPVTITGSATIQATDLSCKVADKVATVKSVEPLRDRHLLYLLMNDRSGSGQRNWPNGVAQQAGIEDLFLNTVIQKAADHGTLINFTDKTYIDVINSDDPAVLSQNIDRKGYGGSATYDAILRSTAWLSKQTGFPDERKVAFMFTDGDMDNESNASARTLIEQLHKNAIPVCVFLPQSATRNKKSIRRYQEIASESGGNLYYLPLGSLSPSFFDAVKSDLANDLLLTISTPAGVGAGEKPLSLSSSLDVKIKAPTKVNVPKQ